MNLIWIYIWEGWRSSAESGVFTSKRMILADVDLNWIEQLGS